MDNENQNKAKSLAVGLDSSIVSVLERERKELQEALSSLSEKSVENVQELVDSLKGKINNSVSSLSAQHEEVLKDLNECQNSINNCLSIIKPEADVNEDYPEEDFETLFVEISNLNKKAAALSEGSLIKNFNEYKHLLSFCENIKELVSFIAGGFGDEESWEDHSNADEISNKKVHSMLESLSAEVDEQRGSCGNSFETCENELIRLSVVCSKINKALE